MHLGHCWGGPRIIPGKGSEQTLRKWHTPSFLFSFIFARMKCQLSLREIPSKGQLTDASQGSAYSQREPILDHISSVEAATVCQSVHDIVIDLRQRFCGAGSKQKDMFLSERERLWQSRVTDGQGLGLHRWLSFSHPGLSFERGLWLQLMSIVRTCCIQDRKSCPGIPEPDEAEPARGLPHVNSGLPVEGGDTHSPTGSVRVTSFFSAV